MDGSSGSKSSLEMCSGVDFFTTAQRAQRRTGNHQFQTEKIIAHTKLENTHKAHKKFPNKALNNYYRESKDGKHTYLWMASLSPC